MSSRFKNAMMSGQAAVCRVASELLLRGLRVTFPTVDSGTDIYVLGGPKVQVKSAILRDFGTGRLYPFKQDPRLATYRDVPDAHVCLGWDEERFWVFPSDLVAGKEAWYGSPRTVLARGLLQGWEERWDLLGETPEGFDRARFQGQAGVYRVASELLRMGAIPSVPLVDDGSDLMVGGTRIQVKTTVRTDTGQIRFGLQDSRYGEVGNRFKGNSDLTVLWLAGTGDFWIVPSAILRGKNCVDLSRETSGYSDLDVSEILRLRSDGLSHEQIALRLGTSVNMVWRREKYGANPPAKYLFNKEARAGKDRWDLITSHARLMAQEDSAEVEITAT